MSFLEKNWRKRVYKNWISDFIFFIGIFIMDSFYRDDLIDQLGDILHKLYELEDE